MPADFDIDDDPRRIDRAVVIDFLTTHAYWGRWRSAADIHAQLDGAWRMVGGYARPSGRMVGFARAVSDGVALAYLADVFVDPACRGHGLGVALVQAMIEDGPGRDFRWLLHTSDAHGLYRKFGFAEPDGTYLERPAGPALRPLS